MRINIIGTSCSGKTTLARHIGKELNIPHIELDSIYWLPSWQELDKESFRQEVSQKVYDNTHWVIDGNYSKVRDILWANADVILWLNYPFHIVFGRCLKRTISRAFTKEKICGDNQESFKISFFSKDSIILWVLKTYKRRRREYPKLLDQLTQKNTLIINVPHPNKVNEIVGYLKNELMERRNGKTAS